MNRFARPLGALALLTGAATAATTIPWQDLTEKDALFDLFTRKAVVDGRTIHYETPTEELAAALTTASAGPDAATATIALRHLAEAKLALGDRAGAKDALRSWAGKVATAQAWDEAAMWGAGRGETAFALEAAAKALAFQDAGSLERRLALASARIGWATSAGLDAATILDLRREQATLFPGDEARVSEYVTALEGAKRYDEARKVLAESKSLSKERRALLTSALEKRQGDAAGAYRTLEALVVAEETPSHELLRTFAALADEAAPGAILEARTRLEKSLDRRSLLLLARYFDGKSRGDLGSSLLTQVLLRHESTASPADLRLVSSLFGALDAVPEAFRTRLAAAKGSSKDDQLGDLAELSVLALRAGSRPLAWGVYGEEPYRWAARVDVTPGFSTGALSFLLTGFDGESALSELESRRMPERTFATAKRLAQELEKRAPKDPRLPALRVGLMSRHVERGEGAEALKLLPLVEAGDAETRAEARRLALLAMRQTKAPLAEETKLWKERLRLLGPEGQTSMAPQVESEEGGNEDEEAQPSASRSSLLERAVGRTSNDRYDSVLREAVSRLNARDTTKKTALDLLLGELDRRPKDERLWLYAAGEISGWNLEDGLEARYKTALDTFGSAGWWDRLARFYARRKKAAELRALVDDLVARFRVAQIFQYAPRIQDLVAVDPASGHPNPFIFFGDAVRLAALERFPQSVTVVKEAESALVAREDYARLLAQKHIPEGRGTVPRSFLTERQNAILFADAPRRSSLIDQLVREKRLQPLLGELERNPQRTPVENLFLAEGWARLSRYEEATPHADALAAAYPGSEEFALQAVTLHRSLSGLDSSHLASVSKTIARTAPALTDPSALFTQEAEASFDLDRAEAAKASVAKLVASAPRGATRDATRVLDAATLLWDYGHMREALTTLETGRKLLDRPRLHAFEAGVLREEVKDLPGAIDEYIGALRGEESWSGGESWGEGEYRARNRLARLLSRKNVLRLFEERIGALQPGIAKDEELLATYLVLLTLEPESREGGIWDDWMDAPRDSVGRDERATARDAAIPKERQGLAQAGAMLLAKTKLMVLKATRIPFLEAVRSRKSGLLRKEVTSDPAEDVNLEVALLTREAELQPTEERRLSREAAKADLLLANGRRAEATAVWASLLPRVEKLPEGADRVRRFAAWARFVETSGGDAAAAWTKVAAAYPWSLGVLEDRVQQLLRSPQPAAGLEVLEAVTAKAASGHRERLLERLAKESLDRGDLPRAERATSALLASKEIDDSRRIAIAGLRSRLGLRSTSFDAMAFAKEEAKKLPTDRHADLYAAVAEAAREERKAPLAVDLYVESLNRSMDQERLRTAARVAVSGGRAPQLLTFFEKQRERSPRDVRWAVAVREIKTFSGDLEGALVAAKQAVEVAPEREYLWRDATTLLERLLRFQEAADYLDGYAKARRASESVAEWRAKLYLRAGNVPKALEVERASIDAYRKEAAAAGKESEEIESEAGARLARAARRFLWAQAPDAAWQMAFPKGVSSALPEALGVSERAEIALRTGNFPALLKRFAADEDFRNQAAEVVSRVATHEQLAELEALLLARIFPATGSPSEAELTRWHGFAQTAGLHRFGEALARKHLASASRPWGVDPPAAFLAERDVVAWRSNPSRAYFSPRTWVGDWARYLEKRDEREKLLAVIGPLVDAIDRVVKAPAPVVPNPDAYDVPPSAVVLALEGPDQEARRAMVSSWLANVNLWNRVRTVTQTWEGAGLLPLADEPSRQAFLARSTPAAALDEVLVARRKVEARVSTALVALVKGEPGALQNDDIVRLRGPRSVGEVLGTDAKFTWPELAPRARETGDDAVFGTGVDEGRLPGRLWGSRPGDSWYVLETLARYREKEPTSPYVPLEVPGRGAESERTLLAGRTAEALGDGALALTLDETYFADLTKRERLSRRLRLLVKNGRKADADALFAKEILARQKTADADAFLSYRVLSKEHGLADPLTLLDTNAVVSPQLKAFLV
ncbi:MAG: hypothetical protein JNK60_06520, partial [Acidobacteria bacterium]|nr:hypothetical protein [Acidobacteriota bacterium]